MADNIEFINKESKERIVLPLDKKMIFIYGKNGSGKTTLSRSINKDIGYVFNEDLTYIEKLDSYMCPECCEDYYE